MAVTHITSGKNIKQAINYVTKGKAHKPNKYIGTKRDLYDAAVNGATDPDLFIKEAQYQLKRDGLYHKGQAQVVRTIISFDPKQLNVKDPNAPFKAGKLARRIAKKIYPHNLSHITIQADGEAKNRYHLPILHAHIITCARRLDNGKSITHDATFRKIQPQVDEVIKKSGYKALDNPYKTVDRVVNGKHKKVHVLKGSAHDTNIFAWKANENLEKKGKHGWIYQLSSILDNARFHSQDMHQYIELANKQGVTVNPFRMNRVKGTKRHGQYQYRFHVYKSNKTKAGKLRKGHYVKIDDKLIKLLSNSGTANLAKNADLSKHKGEFLRLGKQIKYTYNNKVVRAKKLGNVYDRKALNKKFMGNALASDSVQLGNLMEQSAANQSHPDVAQDSAIESAYKSALAKGKQEAIPLAFNMHPSTRTNVRSPFVPFGSRQMNYYNPKKKDTLDHKITPKELHIIIKKQPIQKHSLKHHKDGAPYIASLPKPHLVPVYHMKPSSQPVAKALNRVKTLSQRIASAKKMDKKDLIMKRRAAKDKFDAEAQDFMDKVYKSQVDYEQAKQTNADELSKYCGIVKAYREHQAQNEAEDRTAEALQRLAERRAIRWNNQGPEL